MDRSHLGVAGRHLSTDEVAQILNVSRGIVLRLAMRDELTSYRVGRALRFDPASVRAFLDAHRLSLRGSP
jgi:excisionase family DNA binding protein